MNTTDENMPSPGQSARTRAETTKEKIRNDVVSGHFKPGDRLMMESLAKRYGVSMSPLREALSGLAAEHFIEFERHRGFQVALITKADLYDLTETRKLLEADIVRLALRHGDDVWESKVIAAFHQLSSIEKKIINTGYRDDALWEERNMAFHAAISEACPLQWLQQLRSQIFSKAQRYRHLAWAVMPDAKTVAAEHQEIFDALMARDEDRLVQATEVHIDNVAALALKLLTE